MFWLYSLSLPSSSQINPSFLSHPTVHPWMTISVAQIVVDMWLPLEYGKLISVYTLKRNLSSFSLQLGNANGSSDSSGTLCPILLSMVGFVCYRVFQVLRTVSLPLGVHTGAVMLLWSDLLQWFLIFPSDVDTYMYIVIQIYKGICKWFIW